jgi:rRNA maturation RNase YbeY
MPAAAKTKSIKSHPKFATADFAITKLTKERMPVLPFLRMKNAVLGKKFVLSLVVADDAYTQALNHRYRKKTYIPNVLSFPLSEDEGEIVLNLKQARRECAGRAESFRYFVALLFIHSSLHLKGYRHGSTMEEQEQKFLSKFHITNTFRS